MALSLEPLQPWSWLVTALAALAALAWLTRLPRDRGRAFGVRPWARGLILDLSLLAGALLTLAAWNPQLTARPQSQGVHLAIAIDVSDSVLRTDGGWPRVRATIGARLEEAVRVLPTETSRRATASITTFGVGAPVTARRKLSLVELSAAFQQIDRHDFAVGTGSDLAAGLAAAGQRIEASGGQGAIVLISDGNQTTGDALNAAATAGRHGLPVYVYPIASRGPEIAITSADLPRQVKAGDETYLRGVIHNSRTEVVGATLAAEQNAGFQDPTGRFTAANLLPTAFNLEGDGWGRFRLPVHFTGTGLQFADLILTPEGGAGPHRRRFYTHVVEPPRVLAIGDDNHWLELVPEGAISVTEVSPAVFPANASLAGFDAVVIAGAPAEQFNPGALTTIATAVEREGLGLMVINGGHPDADEQAATVLKSYTDTPLEPLLPVSSRPRPYQAEPPKRQVVILIDSSGSMSGIKIEKAKEVARHIVQDLLRPQDRLDILTFTVGSRNLIDNQPMNDAGKQTALARISEIGAGGGTDPSAALGVIAGRKLTECGLIFISDGEFAPVKQRPECRATVFAIGWDSVPANSPLREFADPIAVGTSFDPTNVIIPYFEPETRKKFWEPGRFTPQAPGSTAGQRDRLPVPELPLYGAAVTYLKEDAELAAVRPKYADPVLAYREAGAGYVGAFTGDVPDDWASNAEAQKAVTAWIQHLLTYQARDRYDFHLDDRGDLLAFRIAVVGQGLQVPEVDRLDARVELQDGTTWALPLSRDEAIPTTFQGTAQIPRKTQVQRGTLVLRESGPDALSRSQRAPLLLPPAGAVAGALSDEAQTYGLNESLLRAIAEMSGGAYDPAPDVQLLHGRPPAGRSLALWPWALTAALAVYLGAVALRRLDL